MTFEEWMDLEFPQWRFSKEGLGREDARRIWHARDAEVTRLREALSPWIEDVTKCINIMDEKGRTGPEGEDHTTMLWSKDWKWVRHTLWTVLEDMKQAAAIREGDDDAFCT